MEIPVCPGCGGSQWELVEDLAGGSKRYELRAAGWTLVDDWLELNQTDYRCRDCGYDPSDDEDEELWELLGDIDTASTAETGSDRPVGDPSMQLWQDRPAA
jgi:hypothetical protein